MLCYFQYATLHLNIAQSFGPLASAYETNNRFILRYFGLSIRWYLWWPHQYFMYYDLPRKSLIHVWGTQMRGEGDDYIEHHYALVPYQHFHLIPGAPT